MPRYQSKQRSDILEAAIGVFAVEGLNGATIRMVAERAGVNSALLYYYFENKECLFRECVREVLDGFLDALANRRKKFNSVRERLVFLVDGILGFFREHPERMRLIGNGVSLHAQIFAQVLNDLPHRRPLLPLDVLREGMDNGELRCMNPLQAWWGIIGMCMFSLYIEDVLPHVRASNIPFELPELQARRDQILEVLLDGMRPHSVTVKRSKKGAVKK